MTKHCIKTYFLWRVTFLHEIDDSGPGKDMEKSWHFVDVSVPVYTLGHALGFLVGWLLNVPATCECISGTDLLRQFYVLPH